MNKNSVYLIKNNNKRINNEQNNTIMAPSLFVRISIAIALIVMLMLLVWGAMHRTTLFNIINADNDAPKNTNTRKRQQRKTAALMLFSASWCPHCKKIVDEWEQFCSEHGGSSFIINKNTT